MSELTVKHTGPVMVAVVELEGPTRVWLHANGNGARARLLEEMCADRGKCELLGILVALLSGDENAERRAAWRWKLAHERGIVDVVEELVADLSEARRAAP